MNFAFHLLFFTKVISTQKEAQSLQGLQKVILFTFFSSAKKSNKKRRRRRIFAKNLLTPLNSREWLLYTNPRRQAESFLRCVQIFSSRSSAKANHRRSVKNILCFTKRKSLFARLSRLSWLAYRKSMECSVKNELVPYDDNLCNTTMRHFNSFSGTQLIFSQTSPSAAFLWVPFLSPPKEMEQKLETFDFLHSAIWRVFVR